MKRVSPHTPLQKLSTAVPAAGAACFRSLMAPQGGPLVPETFRLLHQAEPAAGTAVKSLWKGVWGKAFLQKGFPQYKRLEQGLNQDF